ncbi:MAG: sigma-70 family RNA polymerase sigma factor [bacterium]|nr:sigma-70 family RNA polymerase sigma factor [bacterium]
MSDLTSLVYENENMIYKIINKYTRYFDKDDLYQVAVMGLINAYKNYKEDKNTKFSSYAYFYITGEIKKYLRESNTLKVSKDSIKLNEVIEKTTSYLCQKLQREPSTKEIAMFLEIDEKTIVDAINSKVLVESLDEVDFNDNNLYNKISSVDNNYDSDILDLKIALENLSPEEFSIINERYVNERSQMETSKLLNMTQSMISRKEKDILRRLRTNLK